MSILIVDDSSDSRLLLTVMLQAAGYTGLLTAASARDAFQCLHMHDPAGMAPEVELILLDVLMPETDGIAACRQMKATERLRDIPIIMVTANTDVESLQCAFAAGAMDYITKPLQKGELLARVRSALRLKHEMDRRKAREQELLAATRQLTEANQRLEQAMAALDEQHRLLQAEQERSERLLLNILPKPIADVLKQEPGVIADSAAEVTVLFADLVDFTQLSARLVAREVVALLNEVFSTFDRLAEKHGLEKIKTIGDAYMVVGGLPTPRPDHAEAVAEMALDMQQELAGHTTATGTALRVRIGMNTGPVIAGVIGTKKFIYDLWGDTVNIASRMESQALPGTIQVTPETYHRLHERYVFAERGRIEVKGKGEMVTYLLVGRKTLTIPEEERVAMTPERGTTQEDKIVVHIDADLQELIPGYLDNRQADMQALRQALEQGDYETIRIVGHSMKGSGGGYGFDAITEMGSALEQAATDREPDAIRRWVGELLTYLERVQVVYA